ncbi:hypothetical protein CL673_05995 [Candidatus Bathyarchaeota archaeon]|nr:hypothetical protein [Candidatus Bathyarchaeota archaeon]
MTAYLSFFHYGSISKTLLFLKKARALLGMSRAVEWNALMGARRMKQANRTPHGSWVNSIKPIRCGYFSKKMVNKKSL